MDNQISSMIGVFQTYKSSNSIMDMHRILIKNIQSLRDSVLKEDWKQVKICGASCLGLAYGAKRLLENEGDALRAKMNSTAKNTNNFDKVLKDIILSGDDELINTVFTPIRESLSPFPDELAKFQSTFQKIKDGETEDVSFLKFGSIVSLLSTEPVQLTLVREIALACASRGLMGLVHADFNLSLKHAKLIIDNFHDYDAVPDMELIYNEYRNNLIKLQLQLYNATKQDNHEVFIAIANELLYFIERKLPLFTRSQAWMSLFASTVKDVGKGGEAEKIGTISARAGQLTRESIATYTSCLRIILELASPKITVEVEELFSNASNLPFEMNLPNGTDVELSKLMQSNEGDFVEISGFVIAHQALKTTDQKLISRLTILDPSSGISAKAVAIFTQLAHTGVTIGSYCRISGIYRKNSTLLDDENGVEIDRLSLSELAKNSWPIAFLSLSERWYQAWRNGTNILWGLGPQFVKGDIDGKLDEIGSSFGAGELIYPPFVRNN